MKANLKKLYRWLPFKKAVFTVIKRFWAPPVSIFPHLYFHDSFDVSIGGNKSFKMIHYGHSLENELFWRGLDHAWEKQSMQIWTSLSKDAKVIFDIGANTGLYSLVAKTVNPIADVHAFEPFGAIFTKLQKNAALNSFEMHTNCMAVSDYTGEAVIYTEDPDFAYSVTVNKNLWVKDKAAIKLDIQTTTLKDYIEERHIERIDLVKIDVETHEPEVMKGFAEYFLRFKPILLIEILNDEIAAQLNPYFDPALFDFYNIDELAGIRKVKRLAKSDYYNFLIVPREKAHLYNDKSFIHS